MALSDPLQPFKPLLHDLSQWMQKANTRGVIIGGIAASLWGRPRTTRDVDLSILLAEDQWPRLLSAGQNFGFEPRISDALEFAAEARVLLLQHTPTNIEVDVTFAALPFEEEMIERASAIQINGESVLVCSPEDLIVMKALAGRPRDIADIEGIVDAQSNLDMARIKRYVRELAELLDAPEIAQVVENLLAR